MYDSPCLCFDHVIKDHGNFSTDTIVKTHKVAIKNLISEAWIHDLVFAYYSLYIFHYHTEQPMGSVVILYNFELCSFLHCILYQSVVIVLLCCALEKTVFAIIILSHNLINWHFIGTGTICFFIAQNDSTDRHCKWQLVLKG